MEGEGKGVSLIVLRGGLGKWSIGGKGVSWREERNEERERREKEKRTGSDPGGIGRVVPADLDDDELMFVGSREREEEEGSRRR